MSSLFYQVFNPQKWTKAKAKSKQKFKLAFTIINFFLFTKQEVNFKEEVFNP